MTGSEDSSGNGKPLELPDIPLAEIAEARRTTVLSYVVALVALAGKAEITPSALAAWLHRQYEEAGWYDRFLSEHGPGNLPAFAEEFVRGRRLLHDQSSARIDEGELTVQTSQFSRSDFSVGFFFDVEQAQVEEFFDAVVALHARRIGFDARISRDAAHETLTARARAGEAAPGAGDDGERAGPEVREAQPADLSWIREVLTERWGGTEMVVQGRRTNLTRCPALIASAGGRRIGLLTFRVEGRVCEIMSLDALEPMQGAGRALVGALRQRAEEGDWRRVVVVTTNDNLVALNFYQRLGFRMTAVEPDAVSLSRKFKPSIPKVAENGLPIRDEITLEWP
jgi:N-acetylglutamate synthase-like GNAT family acetyltransferase